MTDSQPICRPAIPGRYPEITVIRFLLPGLLLILGALSLEACQDIGNASPPVPGMSISLTGDLCPSIEISAGDQVTWTNQAQEPHQITGLTEEAEPLFDSGVLNQGDSFSFTFPEAGSYAYTCSTDQDFPATLTVLP